jgi:hypothetical protein
LIYLLEPLPSGFKLSERFEHSGLQHLVEILVGSVDIVAAEDFEALDEDGND